MTSSTIKVVRAKATVCLILPERKIQVSIMADNEKDLKEAYDYFYRFEDCTPFDKKNMSHVLVMSEEDFKE